MRLCIFEDQGVYSLAPLTLTRPAFDLRCGAATLLERQRRCFAATETGVLVRPALVDLCRLAHAELLVNDLDWLSADATVMVNARWLPQARPVIDPAVPQLGMIGEQVAFAILPSQRLVDCWPSTLDDTVADWLRVLPRRPTSGSMIDYPWDLVAHNADALCREFPARRRLGPPAERPPGLMVVGPDEQLWIDPSARIEPLVVVDVTHGPVLVEADAVVQAFSRLEGPCSIGKGTTVSGARIRGSTIGPSCKIGGEIEASIIHGYSNKAHEGFVGHSYVGEWVNLGAGTQFSDLRHDYGPVRVMIGGDLLNTGQIKVGSFVGDHSKTGLNTLLNTGSVVGSFSSLMPSGSLLPRVVPSFSTVSNGELRESNDLEGLLKTAAVVMGRRGCAWTPTHADFFRSLHDWTAIQRHQIVRENSIRRQRMSV